MFFLFFYIPLSSTDTWENILFSPLDQPSHAAEILLENLESSGARGTQEFIPQTPNVSGRSQWVQFHADVSTIMYIK